MVILISHFPLLLPRFRECAFSGPGNMITFVTLYWDESEMTFNAVAH